MTTRTNLFYLDRLDLYRDEKPYIIAFDIPEAVGQSSNHQYKPHEVQIHDLTSQKDQFTLASNGFEYHHWPTKFQSADFDTPHTVKHGYYPELLKQMRLEFPSAREIHVLTHLVRIRTMRISLEG